MESLTIELYHHEINRCRHNIVVIVVRATDTFGLPPSPRSNSAPRPPLTLAFLFLFGAIVRFPWSYCLPRHQTSCPPRLFLVRCPIVINIPNLLEAAVRRGGEQRCYEEVSQLQLRFVGCHCFLPTFSLYFCWRVVSSVGPLLGDTGVVYYFDPSSAVRRRNGLLVVLGGGAEVEASSSSPLRSFAKSLVSLSERDFRFDSDALLICRLR